MFWCAEETFFKAVKNRDDVQKGHPLTHLVTSYRSIQQHSIEKSNGSYKPAGIAPVQGRAPVQGHAHRSPYFEQPALLDSSRKKTENEAKSVHRQQISKSSKQHREFLMSTHFTVFSSLNIACWI